MDFSSLYKKGFIKLFLLCLSQAKFIFIFPTYVGIEATSEPPTSVGKLHFMLLYFAFVSKYSRIFVTTALNYSTLSVTLTEIGFFVFCYSSNRVITNGCLMDFS